jgi:hypothetical protein
MTSYADYTQWQDVYHVPSPVGVLYVKFTADVLTEFLLLSVVQGERLCRIILYVQKQVPPCGAMYVL